jgi:hypothetical protein
LTGIISLRASQQARSCTNHIGNDTYGLLWHGRVFSSRRRGLYGVRQGNRTSTLLETI